METNVKAQDAIEQFKTDVTTAADKLAAGLKEALKEPSHFNPPHEGQEPPAYFRCPGTEPTDVECNPGGQA